jgi:tetratricopeptide (TPR) repeat protein
MAGRASRYLTTVAACLLAMPPCVAPFLPQTATAQTINNPEIPGKEDEEERRRRERAAEDAREVISDEGVTYQDILKDPDNLELNLRYARGQIARGELKGASATLERILLINPDIAQVRLYYAIVLFRLDNPEEAERELLALKELELPPEIEREVDNYLSEIALRRERLRFTLALSFGGFFDDNKTAGSKTDQQLVVGTLVDLGVDDVVHDDFGLLGVASLGMSYDLGLQDKHQVIGSASHYISEQATLETFNTQSLSVEGGLELNYPYFTFTPTAFTQSTFLSRERYFRGWGVGGKLRVPIDGALSVRLEGRYTNEKFNGIEESASAVLRSGHRHDYQAGIDYILNPSNRLSLEYHQRFKRARREFYEYDGNKISASHTWLIGGGHYILSTASYDMRLYAGPDGAVSAERRKDRITQVRLTYGMPFSTVVGNLLFSDMPPDPVFDTILGGWTLNLSGEVYTQRSNITTYDYRNLRGQAIFSKRFQF